MDVGLKLGNIGNLKKDRKSIDKKGRALDNFLLF